MIGVDQLEVTLDATMASYPEGYNPYHTKLDYDFEGGWHTVYVYPDVDQSEGRVKSFEFKFDVKNHFGTLPDDENIRMNLVDGREMKHGVRSDTAAKGRRDDGGAGAITATNCRPNPWPTYRCANLPTAPLWGMSS